MQGWPYNVSQAQTNAWMHHGRPVCQHALAAWAMPPARDASCVAVPPLTVEGAPALAIDGTERRRQRPTDAAWHQDHSSGTKPAHTDKPIVVSNEHTGQVVSLGPTIPGKTHDKQAGEGDSDGLSRQRHPRQGHRLARR